MYNWDLITKFSRRLHDHCIQAWPSCFSTLTLWISYCVQPLYIAWEKVQSVRSSSKGFHTIINNVTIIFSDISDCVKNRSQIKCYKTTLGHFLFATNLMNFLSWYTCRHSMDGYTTCPTELTGDTCSLSVTEFLLYPIIGFILWQAIYFLWVSKLYVNTKFCMKNCLMHI